MQQPELRHFTSHFGFVRVARIVKTRAWLLPVLMTLAVTVACDKVPLTSPTGSTITLSVAQTTVPINGTIEVIAAVIEAGGTAVHDGTSVTFTGGLGTFSPVEAQTVGGLARTFFRGTTSGTVKIGAFSGAAKATEVEVKVGAAAAGSIAISASPPSVSQSGGTVTIQALVLDSSGNPLPGVNVTFSSNNGALSSNIALTDGAGIARTQLTTTSTATVTATAGAATPKDVTVTVSAAPTVTIDAPAPAVAGVPVAITVTTTSGPAATPRQVQSLTVDFGDGSSESRSNVTGSSAFTHTYQQPRGYTSTATSVDVSGNTGVASKAIVVNRVVPTVTVTPSDTTPQVNQIIGFTITSSPGAGGPPVEQIRAFIDGELVFSTSGSSGAFSKGFSSTGTYLIEVQATDAAGNVGKTQTFLTVTP